MNTIQIGSPEIFKQNEYIPKDIGMVSNNAYLSIVATNNCQCKCPYCINSETDHRLNLPIAKATLGFVRYLLIPTPCPIIINWNSGSRVAEQVCENDIPNRKVNTFKCLVNGDISLSWNTNNIII